jgi:hypothetical protein
MEVIAKYREVLLVTTKTTDRLAEDLMSMTARAKLSVVIQARSCW